MGIDGRLLVGDGIFINPYYLPDNLFNFLDNLARKYPYLFEYNYMDGITRNQNIIIWGQYPTTLFPVDAYDRRPLIINNSDQLALMNTAEDRVDLNQKGLWEPSYNDFTIRLNDYYDKEDDFRQSVINYVQSIQYEVSDDFLAKLLLDISKTIKTLLHPDEFIFLKTILQDQRYTLIGRWMIYIAN